MEQLNKCKQLASRSISFLNNLMIPASLTFVSINGVIIIITLAILQPFLVAQLYPKPVSASTQTLPWLKTVGNKITNQSGQEVILRGVNIMRSEWNGGDMTFERQAFPVIANTWKGNVILRGFAANPVIDNDQSYLAILDEERALAEANGMYIIFVWRSDDINGDQPGRPDNTTQPALVKLAQRYYGKSNVIYGVEVEPFNVTWAVLRPKYETIINAIRVASAPYKPIVMVSGTEWSRYFEEAETNPVNSENVVYKSHPYDSSSEFQQEFIGPHNAGLPVFLGEFGTGSQMSQSDVNTLLTQSHNLGISWTAWIFDSEGPPVLLTDRTSMNPVNPYGVSVKNEMLTTPAIPPDFVSPSPSASPSKVGDIDGNNQVDIFDYNLLLTNFGKTGPGIQGDIDGNNKVDIFDYNLLLTNFGR